MLQMLDAIGKNQRIITVLLLSPRAKQACCFTGYSFSTYRQSGQLRWYLMFETLIHVRLHHYPKRIAEWSIYWSYVLFSGSDQFRLWTADAYNANGKSRSSRQTLIVWMWMIWRGHMFFWSSNFYDWTCVRCAVVLQIRIWFQHHQVLW